MIGSNGKSGHYRRLIPLNSLCLNPAPSKLYGLTTVSFSGLKRRSRIRTMKRQRGTGSVFLREDSTIWSYQIFVNGKRERGSTGQRNKREAEAFVRRKLSEYSVGLSSPDSDKATVKELMEDILLRNKNDGNRR